MNCLAEPIKSPNDKKLYRVLQLPNGLRALLISDPSNPEESGEPRAREPDSGHVSADEVSSGAPSDEEEDGEEEEAMEEDEERDNKEKMAAAALCINVGSFSDPEDLQGLAHYLEHMVFMGSEKYPDENGFSAFMKKRSGSENAFTDCERTVFKLEIHPKHFHEALDRFAQFFISPLMKKDSMDRELEAVDSEFNLNLPQDSTRRLLLMGNLSKEGSPMRQFMWGNSDTLKKQPEANDVDVYSRLRLFWAQHYSAQFMTLAVQSTESLDTLEQWVNEHYSAIPNNQMKVPSFEEHVEPFKTPEFCKLYKLCPVKKTHSVFITWSLPSLLSHYKCKPLHYIGHLIGYEGKGSLLAFLRKKAWAVSLECGNDESGTDHNSIHACFVIKLNLTDSGIDNLHHVLNLVFQYVNLVRTEGLQPWIFEELKMIQDNQFRFQEEDEAVDYVETVCEHMQLYPPEHYLTGSKLFYDYDPDIINSCMQSLTPDQANFMILSTHFKADDPCDLREKWTQMPYCITDVPSSWLDGWKELPQIPELHLPLPNPYIASDFEIKPDVGDRTEYPVKIFEDEQCKLYYKKDYKFKVPKASINFHLLSGLPGCCPENAVLTDLFLEVVDQRLSVDVYPARIASLSYHLYGDESGLVIKTNGLSHKLPKLLETILDHLSNFEVDPELFEEIKKQLMKTYNNDFDRPENLCRHARLALILSTYWTPLDKRAVLPGITFSMLQSFAKLLFNNMFVEGLVQGNISPQEAVDLIQLVYKKLACSPLPQNLIPQIRVAVIPVANLKLRVASFNKEDSNSVITNYFQTGPADIYKETLMELLCEMMEEPCFDTLRTKDQLGYCANVSMRKSFGIIGFTITVHSSGDKFSCTYVDSRIELFLEKFLMSVAEMPKEEFDMQVLALVRLKQCEDLMLKEEANRNWGEVTNFEYVFDRLQQQVVHLKTLKLEVFQSWVAEEIMLGRKLSTQVVGNGQVSKDDCLSFPEFSGDDNQESSRVYSLQVLQPKEPSKSSSFINDICVCKDGLNMYPVTRICH